MNQMIGTFHIRIAKMMKTETESVVPIGPLSAIHTYHQRKKRKFVKKSELSCARIFLVSRLVQFTIVDLEILVPLQFR